MNNDIPSLRSLIVIRGKEIMTAFDEVNTEWDLFHMLYKGTPSIVDVERVLKERIFEEVTVQSVDPVDMNELADTGSTFRDTPVYVCTVSSQTKKRSQRPEEKPCRIFFAKCAKRDRHSPVEYTNTVGFQLSEKAFIAITLPSVQSRLE